MRKVFITVLIAMLFLAGCSGKKFNPFVTQQVTVFEINQEYDPLTLLKDVERVGLVFEVVENTVNISEPGDYHIKYRITSRDGKHSVERTYEFSVADTEAPELTINDVITIKRGSTFIMSEHARAYDKRDGDLTSSIVYTGVVDAFKEGEYPVKISVSDRFGNTTVRDIIIKVEYNPDENAFANSIIGKYTDVSITTGNAPTITFNEDGTYIFYINGCSVVSAVEGKYIVYEDTIYLSSNNSFYGSTPETDIATFKYQLDGSIVFTGELRTCAPNYGDKFFKENP